jgi:hypothetical protein
MDAKAAPDMLPVIAARVSPGIALPADQRARGCSAGSAPA